MFEKVLLSMKVTKEPFFYYILNIQSHPTGDIPEDYDWPDGTEEKKVFKYFDISIKKFFEKAQELPFYENTIFIILADHTEHYQTYNDTDDKDLGISLWEFRIPLIIYIPKLNLSNKISLNGFSSQTDIMPTIFDILDIDTTNKGWGESIFCKEQTDKYPTILFSRRQNVISVIKEEQIYSSDFKTFFQNDLLEYDKENPYGFPLKKIKNIDENVIKDLNRFI